MTAPNNINLLLEILDRAGGALPPAVSQMPVIATVTAVPIDAGSWVVKLVNDTGAAVSLRTFEHRAVALQAAAKIAELLDAEIVH